jgi:hypothetical protein
VINWYPKNRYLSLIDSVSEMCHRRSPSTSYQSQEYAVGRYGLYWWDVDSFGFNAPVAMHNDATIHARLSFN